MNTQTALVLTLVLAAALYFGFRLFREWREGSCASGCGGSCGSKGCPVRKLHAVAERLEEEKRTRAQI